jgi:Zn-dependent protease
MANVAPLDIRRSMPGRTFKVGRIAGIPVGISPWWLVIVALFTWSLGSRYFPGGGQGDLFAGLLRSGLAIVLLLFASIPAHAFGHGLVAPRRGVEVEEIDLWLLGGVSRMRGQPKTADDELLYALAGPAVTAVSALVFGLARLLPSTAPRAVHALIVYQAEVNAAIFLFNLLQEEIVTALTGVHATPERCR